MTLIYEPKGAAREYSELACNLYIGCDHGCRYCYVPTLPFSYFERHNEPRARPAFSIKKLEREAASRAGGGETGRVLLCFTTDPYQSVLNNKYGLAREAIETLHRYGFTVQVLTKNPADALYDLSLFGEGDALAVTLTFPRGMDEFSSIWEPEAPLPSDRIWALERFHEAGVQTWVSLEPVLNPDATLSIIDQTADFVDHYKIGKINHVEHLPKDLRQQVEGCNWQGFLERVSNLFRKYDFEAIDKPAQVKPQTYYLKDSLRHIRVKEEKKSSNFGEVVDAPQAVAYQSRKNGLVAFLSQEGEVWIYRGRPFNIGAANWDAIIETFNMKKVGIVDESGTSEETVPCLSKEFSGDNRFLTNEELTRWHRALRKQEEG